MHELSTKHVDDNDDGGGAVYNYEYMTTTIIWWRWRRLQWCLWWHGSISVGIEMNIRYTAIHQQKYTETEKPTNQPQIMNAHRNGKTTNRDTIYMHVCAFFELWRLWIFPYFSFCILCILDLQSMFVKTVLFFIFSFLSLSLCLCLCARISHTDTHIQMITVWQRRLHQL